MFETTRSASALPARLAPFGRDRRPAIVDALVNDPVVRSTALDEARATSTPSEIVMARVRAYAEEIVPRYNARLFHRLAYRVARRLATILFRVRVGYVDESVVRDVPADATVVFVINHRSNIDYVLVAFLVGEHVPLSFAVGEWARIWPLDTIIRALGAFFVRRDSRNRLYRRVLERYVQLAVEHGVTQAVFVEGGLSRDGRLRPPKLGLLSYLTRSMTRETPRDLVFVPVAINYDRVLEDRHLLRDLDPHVAPASAVLATLRGAAWVVKNVRLYVLRQWYRFGYACVNFGPPISFRHYLAEHRVDFVTIPDERRFAETERLAALLMDEISHVVPVTPVSVVCSALLSLDQPSSSKADVGARVAALLEELSSVGARLYVPRRDAEYFVDVGLRMLILRHLVDEEAGQLRIVPAERRVIAYYANSLEHFFAGRASAQAVGEPACARRPLAERAVVLVHGLARTSRSMVHLGHALERAGYAVFNWDYPSRAYGVLPLVEALERYAQDAATMSGRLHFVTHSMGGLLARGVLSHATWPQVGRLVMLAPPNRGAQLASRASAYAWARGFYGQALEELRPDRAAALEARIGQPRCEFGVIAGTRSFHPLQPTSYVSSLTRPAESHDGTVGVDETRLSGMADFVTVRANHMSIMDHEETIRQTIHFLEHGRFRHAT